MAILSSLHSLFFKSIGIIDIRGLKTVINK